MKKIELNSVEHIFKAGMTCPSTEPNVKEDCVLIERGKAIGFFMRKMPKNMCNLANIANTELRSKRVPKSTMKRSNGVLQYSTILGGIPPKPHMRRTYKTMSSVHTNETAQTFIQAMLMLAECSAELIKEILPEQFECQKEIFESVEEDYRLTDMFTSSISNYNIAADYHRDTGNIKDTVNVIITRRKNAKGGNLNVPDYGATFDQCNNSILVYPAWRNLHGVTPIDTLTKSGYRNSLIFYPLSAFLNGEGGKC